ncbi:MAG: kinase/pyrophosphorylase [bacterium]|nr:kinase/pyrophosphorylase [bacterium]
MLSDATGSTAETVVKSALAQFPGAEAMTRRFSFVRTPERIEQIIRDRKLAKSVVVYLFVSPKLSQKAASVCAEESLQAIDLLTPMMGMIGDVFRSTPERPTVMPFLPDHVFELAVAIEYTLNHDDGKGMDTLGEADLIILGVSRSGKTPTSIYLGCRKIKTANIPIIEGAELPDFVRRLPVPKVGFLVSLDRQLKLRSERSQRLGAPIPGYSDRRSIFSELEYCDRLFRTIPGIRTIDVSKMAVEEVADWIVRNVLPTKELRSL